MNPYIEQLNHELKEYQAKCSESRPVSILDFLWYRYSASNPVDDGRIRAAEEALQPVFDELSMDTSDILFSLISDLCIEYQRSAFLEVS